MKLKALNVKCSECGSQYKAGEVASGLYGEFILRSSTASSEAYLDALNDNTYEEVFSLIKTNVKMEGKRPREIADVVRKTYGIIACDPDEEGSYFCIGKFPPCPVCGSQNIDCWEAIEPSEMVDKKIPHVTHRIWSSLSGVEKERVVDEVLSKF